MGRKPKMEKLVMLELLKKTYAGKKVFLTGHTGFKGSWLLLMLKELGAEVMGYSLKPETPKDLYYQINGDQLCESIIGDIRNEERVKHAIIDFQPDFVIHMAAQALVIPSYTDPVGTMSSNIMGTIHVMEGFKHLTKPCVMVNITTDKVYENKERLEPYIEEDPKGGHDPYSASKAAAEIVSQSYRLSFFNPEKYDDHKKSMSTVRSGNVIGGGDWNKARIIPDLARALSVNEKLILRNPNAVRPWQHVLDPLYGYLLLGAKMAQNPVKYADAYNFGPEPENELTVEELIKISIHTWGSGSYEIQQKEDQLHEAGLLKLDITKAKTTLNWQPQLNAQDTISWTIDWYKTESENWGSKTRNQVIQYLEKL